MDIVRTNPMIQNNRQKVAIGFAFARQKLLDSFSWYNAYTISRDLYLVTMFFK